MALTEHHKFVVGSVVVLHCSHGDVIKNEVLHILTHGQLCLRVGNNINGVSTGLYLERFGNDSGPCLGQSSAVEGVHMGDGGVIRVAQQDLNRGNLVFFGRTLRGAVITGLGTGLNGLRTDQLEGHVSLGFFRRTIA